MDTANKKEPLREFRSTPKEEKFFVVADLESVVSKTHAMLADTLDTRFFKRVTDLGERMKVSFVFELQLFLHPQSKNIKETLGGKVTFCSAHIGVKPDAANRIADVMKNKIIEKVKTMMAANARSAPEPPPQPTQTEAAVPGFAAHLISFFQIPVQPTEPVDVSDGRVEENIQRWLAGPLVAVVGVLKSGHTKRKAVTTSCFHRSQKSCSACRCRLRKLNAASGRVDEW